MKILLVIPTISYGGAERVMTELANNWSSRGHEVILVLLARDTKAYDLNDSVKVVELCFENRGKLKRIFYETKTLFALRELLKKESPDFVLSFLYKCCVLTILSAVFLNLRVYVSDRNNPKMKLPLPLTAFLRKITYRFATGVVAQTFEAKCIIEQQTKNQNVEVIPNPLKHIDLYPHICREKIILNLGRLHPQKGQKYLLEILVKANLPDWKLVILGDGELLKSLQMQAKKLGIEDQVIFAGNVSNVDEWFARSSVFVLTSLFEGFPNALAEAMASGLPCISFDCDTGPGELIRNGNNGYLIQLKDIKSFSDKLSHLANDKKLMEEVGINAMNIRNDLFVDSIADRYFKFCSPVKNE